MSSRSAIEPPGVEGDLPPGLERIRERQLLREAPVVWFPLHPGDRALVKPGDAVPAGGLLLERVRAASIVDVPPASVPGDASPGDWWIDDGHRHGLRRSRARAGAGELLYRGERAWRAIAGDRTDVVESPVAGIVREVRPGIGISMATGAVGLVGIGSVGGPSHGRLDVVSPADGELRPGSLDVRRAGAVVVAGSRVDAETLTRARAMGIRGIVAAAIATRELRDLAASEARQRASLQPIPPFAVLALEGHVRTPIAGPVMAILGALAGRDVALVGDPPLLLVDRGPDQLPAPAPGLVRVRSGVSAGREGRWAGLAGPRRFASGVRLDAGFVDVGDAAPLVVPLTDLERFA